MAGAGLARSVSSPRWLGWLRSYGLLGFAMLMFAALLVLSFQELRRQHEGEIQDIGTSFWRVSQAGYELERLRHALDAYALGHQAYDHDALMQRFDVFWSHLKLLNEGPDRAISRESGLVATVVPRLLATLQHIEPDLLVLEPRDPAAHRRLSARLDQLLEPLHRLGVDVQSSSVSRYRDQQSRDRELAIQHAGCLLGILASGGLLIALLVREGQRTRALLAEATLTHARIEHLAYHDPLTNLPNRLLFADRLVQALRRADRARSLVALHYLDVDHFKAVNDRYGHVVGDRVLQSLAARIAACLRQSDTLARLGGDELAIIQCDLGEPDAAQQLAERVLGALDEAIVLDALAIPTAVSIGISLYPDHATSAAALQWTADQALYQAKAQGRAGLSLWRPQEGASPRSVATG